MPDPGKRGYLRLDGNKGYSLGQVIKDKV